MNASQDPAAPKWTFEDMFGPGATYVDVDVDYSVPVGTTRKILPLPTPTDDLYTTARRLEALAKVVEAGKSVAVATGHEASKHKERDLVGVTKELKEMEMAEIETAHKAVAIAMDNRNRAFAAMKSLCGQINHAKDIIQARQHAIKSKLPNYKGKKRRINDQPYRTLY